MINDIIMRGHQHIVWKIRPIKLIETRMSRVGRLCAIIKIYSEEYKNRKAWRILFCEIFWKSHNFNSYYLLICTNNCHYSLLEISQLKIVKYKMKIELFVFVLNLPLLVYYKTWKPGIPSTIFKLQKHLEF